MIERIFYVLYMITFLISIAYASKWIETIVKRKLTKNVYVIHAQGHVKSHSMIALVATFVCVISGILLFILHTSIGRGMSLVFAVLLLLLANLYSRRVFYNREGFFYQFVHIPYSKIHSFSSKRDGNFHVVSVETDKMQCDFKIRESDWIRTLESAIARTRRS